MTIVMLFSPVAMLLVGLVGVHSYDCTGMGRKYCSSETPADQAKDECPVPCQRSRCQGRRSTELLSSGARRSSREGGTPKWEEIALSGEEGPGIDSHFSACRSANVSAKLTFLTDDTLM